MAIFHRSRKTRLMSQQGKIELETWNAPVSENYGKAICIKINKENESWSIALYGDEIKELENFIKSIK